MGTVKTNNRVLKDTRPWITTCIRRVMLSELHNVINRHGLYPTPNDNEAMPQLKMFYKHITGLGDEKTADELKKLMAYLKFKLGGHPELAQVFHKCLIEYESKFILPLMLLLSIKYFERDKHNRKAPFPNRMWYYGCTKTAGKKVAKRMLPVLASFGPPDGNENAFESINYFRDLSFLRRGDVVCRLRYVHPRTKLRRRAISRGYSSNTLPARC